MQEYKASTFFEEIKVFTNEQNEQKKRGLNNYNIMAVLRNLDAEVGMHSRFISSLLDTNGEHYQGTLFIDLFIKHVLNISDFGNNIKFEEEEVTKENRRIDFTIKSDKYFIGIEMKINADDQDKQIFDYYKELLKQATKVNIDEENVKIYYLTLNGKEASSESLNGMSKKEYVQVAFDNEILTWLAESKKQVSNITNLNNAIGYYTDVIKMLIGKYESPINQFSDFFLESKERYEAYEKYKDEKEVTPLVIDGFEKAEQELHNNYFKNLLHQLFKKYSDLTFFKYLTKDKKIKLIYKEYFEIGFFIGKHNFKSIYIAPNWNLEYQGNKRLKSTLENINNFLYENEITTEYKIGKKKGVNLSQSPYKPKITTDTLFKSDEYFINIDEINIHIDQIINVLETINKRII